MILSKILSRILRASARPLLILPSIFSVGLLFPILSSCGSTQTIPIEKTHEVLKTDTIYINNVQYDSIYVSQNRYIDRSRDTILISQHDVEYRYKLLRDTIERIKLEIHHDSIPYEVRITEVKEVTKPPNLFDKLCKYTFFLLLGILTIWIFLKFKLLNF